MKKYVGPVLVIVLIIGLLVCIILGSLGGQVSTTFEQISAPLESAKPPQPSAWTQVSEEQYTRQLATAGETDVDSQTGLNRMVVYNSNLDLVVQDTQQAIEMTRKIIQDAGGYIAESGSYRDKELLRASITARVPSDQLNETIERLKKIALFIDRENLKGEDVTDQYTDLQSRLRNLEASEQQYLEILKRADKIEDVLAVQQRLDDTRGQIEQAKGRIEYLSKSAAFATITVTLTPDALARPITVSGWRPASAVRNAFEALLSTLEILAEALIWIVVWLLPTALIVGVPSYLVFRWARKWWQKTQTQKEPTVED